MNIKLRLAAFDFIVIIFLEIFNTWMSSIIINKLGCFWIFDILRIVKDTLRLTFKIFLWTVYISNWCLNRAFTCDIIRITKKMVCLSDWWWPSCYLTGLLLHLKEVVIRYYFQLKFSYTIHQLFVFIFKLFILLFEIIQSL